jgi:poly(3-hydroxybutyrate) depolymerase
MRIVLASALVLFAASDARAAGHRVTFPYRDGAYLWAGESNGGEAFVPDAVPAGERVPLVVFFHGVNVDRVLHFWAGGRGEPDLIDLVDRSVANAASVPFIFAAPSQTRGAMSGLHMWQDFDLDEFVRAVDAAIGPRAEIDRDRIILLGHSGGGCNIEGGMFRAARASRIAARAILAVDTCMDEEDGVAYADVPESTQVIVRWQPDIWPRPVEKFRAAFKGASAQSGHGDLVMQLVPNLGPAAHEAILVDTFASVLPQLLAGQTIASTP